MTPSPKRLMQELIALEIDLLPPEQSIANLLNCCFDQYMEVSAYWRAGPGGPSHQRQQTPGPTAFASQSRAFSHF